MTRQAAFRRLPRLLPFLVAGATLLAFLPVLRFGFVNWDDPGLLLNNPHYRGLGPERLLWMFSTFHMGNYCPLSWLSWGLDYVLWGMNPVGYHAVNLLLHAANAAVVYCLVLHLLRLARGAPGRGVREPLAAAAAALLFSVHPLRVESVAWISERRDVLSGFFFLLTLLFYVRGRRRAALAAYAASLLSKGSGVSLPAVLLVLDVYPLRRPPRVGLLWEKAPFILFAAAASSLALLAQGEGSRILTLEELGVGGRVAQSAYCFVFYIGKTLLPAGLNPLYGRPDRLVLGEWPYWPALALVLAATIALFLSRRRWPAAIAAWAAYVVMLAPLSGVFPNGPQIAADRYTYLACLGWPMLAAGGALESSLRRGASRRARAWPSWALAAALAALGVLTWRQTGPWRDSLVLWRRIYPANRGNTLAQVNTAATFYNEGVARASRGDEDEAENHYREALVIYPAYWKARLNLANLLSRRGRFCEAFGHYRVAFELNPEEARIRTGLELALRGCPEAREAAGRGE